MRHLRFSTDGIVGSERSLAFQQTICSLLQPHFEATPPLERQLQSAGLFPARAEMNGYFGRRLRFASWEMSAHSTSVPGRIQSGMPRMFVMIPTRGLAKLSQSGRACTLAPGQFCLIDPARPFTMESDDISCHSLYLEREMVEAAIPGARELTARTVDGNRGAGALFKCLAEGAIGMASVLEEDVADAIAHALPYALAAALVPMGSDVLQGNSKIRELQLRRVRRFALEHLHDGGLTVEMIAEGVKLTKRHIYELFSNEPVTLMKWILNERLERCRRDLESRTLGSISIGEIAYTWGFTNNAHFSRTFRRAYGSSPRTWRHRARQPMLDS